MTAADSTNATRHDAPQLMDAGLAFAERIRATVVHDDAEHHFDLPVWVDGNGRLRVALPKPAPRHGSDHDQVIVDVASLLRAVGGALERQASTHASAHRRAGDDAEHAPPAASQEPSP